MSGAPLALLAQLALILGVAVFVFAPIVLHRGERAWVESGDEARRRSIGERKARLYTTIVELDFDRDSGKISAEDHAHMRAETMAEVLAVLQEEEALGVPPGRPRPAVIQGGDQVERMIEDFKRKRRLSPGASRP